MQRVETQKKKKAAGMVTAVFDDRERDLYALVAAAAVRHNAALQARVERLPMGDVVLAAAEGGDGEAIVVVERKRVADLMCSRTDGRLSEQLGRLAAWRAEHPRAWTVALVEGATAAGAGPFGGRPDRYRWFIKVYLQTAMVATDARALVLRTCSAEESALLLLTLHKTIFSGTAQREAAQVLLSLLPPKGRAPAVERHFAATLGVSGPRAARAAAAFPSVAALLEAYGRDAGGTFGRLVDALGGGAAVAARVLADLGAADAEGTARAWRASERRRANHLRQKHRQGQAQNVQPLVGAAVEGELDDARADDREGERLPAGDDAVVEVLAAQAVDVHGDDGPAHHGAEEVDLRAKRRRV